MNETSDGKTHGENSEHETWLFPIVWVGFVCLLIALTHRLWFVQNDVPPVAMFHWVDALPGIVGWVPLMLILLGSLLVIRRQLAPQRAWWLVAIGLAISFAFDQHRLQPWAYQSAIYATVFATMRPSRARRLLIPLAASIYVYSAAGKLDFQFVHSVGQDFLGVLLGPLGLAETFSPATRVKIAFCFPLVELTAGLLLLPALTRCYAAYVLIAMHVSLLLMLGPLGLNHSNGVLVWNIALLVQAYFLFVAPTPLATKGRSERNHPGQWIAILVVFIAIVAPVTEWSGVWDHWTSWALYSPHNSRVTVQVHRSVLDDLPNAVREHVAADDDGDGWQSLALDQWSLKSLSVPVYPQGRYQLALIERLWTQNDLDDQSIRCRLRGISSRADGKRNETPLLGIAEVRETLKEFWFVP